MTEPTWEHLQTFLLAAESGSFTGAARTLGVSQPTVSRRIEDLEVEVGAALFVRHSRGLDLTDRGAALLEGASGIAETVREVFRRARGDEAGFRGTVRISLNETIAAYALPRTFAGLLEDHPGLQLETVVDNSVSDLSRREADVAVRMFEPNQGGLIAKKLGEITLGFYASEDYLRRRPHRPGMGLGEHVVLGLDRDPSWPRMLRGWGAAVSDFGFRTDFRLLHIQAAIGGVGVAAMHKQIGRFHGLVELPPMATLPPVEVWLVRHEALRNDPGVRTVCDAIERGVLEYLTRRK